MLVPHQQTSQTPPRAENGFVLVATLSLLGLAVATLIAFTLLLQSESELSDVKSHLTIAKRNASIGMDLAIAQLQLHTGIDKASTCPAGTLRDDVLHPHWTYSSDAGGVWFVSSNDTKPNPNRSIDPNLTVTVVGQGTVGASSPESLVIVEKVPLISDQLPDLPSGATTGFYAYWVGEENTKANIAYFDTLEQTALSEYEKTSASLSNVRRTITESIFPSIMMPEEINQTSRLIRPEQMFFLENQSPDPMTFLQSRKESFFDFTTYSRGVLCDTQVGGLKINLTDKTYRDSLVTDEVSKQIDPSNNLAQDQYTFTPENFTIKGNQEDPVHPNHPIITEFKLSMGIFHAQSDGRHRIRFHIYSELLNPYPYDIGFKDETPSNRSRLYNLPEDKARSYAVVVDGLPILRIENEESGFSFDVDLNDFDPSFRYNYNTSTQIQTWIELDQLTNPRTSHLMFGIDKGEVYESADPDPVTQGRGLVRVLYEGPKGVYVDENAPSTGRLAGKFYADDSFRIRTVSGGNSVRVRLIPIIDEDFEHTYLIPPFMDVGSWADARRKAVEMINIPYGDIDFSLSASTYSRPNSSDFGPPDYKLGYYFRLRDDPDALEQISKSSIHAPLVDFSQSHIRSLYEIESNPRAAQDAATGFSQFDAVFKDENRRQNENDSNSDDPRVHLFDLPITEPVSTGVFSQLRKPDQPHPWVGSPTATAWNVVYDRYYFSGDLASESWNTEPENWVEGKLPGGTFLNHRIEPITKPDGSNPTSQKVISSTGAAHSLLKGAFNIHSTSLKAWTAVLKNSFRNNPTLHIQNGNGSEFTKNVFARLPFGSPKIENQKEDLLISGTPDGTINGRDDPDYARFKQGVRALSDEYIEKLANQIVLGIRAYVTSKGLPIRSIGELVNSGIIDKAILATNINDNISPLASGFLRQSDVLNLLAPFITTRSDTFTIRSYGESTDPRTGKSKAKIVAEAVVQRMPYFVDSSNLPETPLPDLSTTNLRMGRRYEIVSFRWIYPHKI